MPFAPHEIESKRFVVAFRGYQRDEVDSFLRAVAADYRAALEQDGGGDVVHAARELKRVVQEAEREAAEIRAAARAEAAEIVAQARYRAESLGTETNTEAATPDR